MIRWSPKSHQARGGHKYQEFGRRSHARRSARTRGVRRIGALDGLRLGALDGLVDRPRRRLRHRRRHEVPDAEANCLALLVRGQPRPELPAGAVFANLMLAAAASDGPPQLCPPQLYETEGYAVFDPVTGHEHASQTANIDGGRVVPVRQRHGLLSRVLVARKGGEPDLSFEATVLHRGF